MLLSFDIVRILHGDLKINAAISKDEFFKDELRYFYKIVGEFNLPSDVKLQLNFGQVSDDAYLGDYSYNLDSKLESKVILSKLFVDKSRHFQGKLAYVNDRSDDSALSQYYSIQGDYIKHIPQNLFLGNLYLEAGINSFSVSEESGFSRPPSSALIG